MYKPYTAEQVDKTSVNCELVILRGFTEINRNATNGSFGWWRCGIEIVRAAETGLGSCEVCERSWAKLGTS